MIVRPMSCFIFYFLHLTPVFILRFASTHFIHLCFQKASRRTRQDYWLLQDYDWGWWSSLPGPPAKFTEGEKKNVFIKRITVALLDRRERVERLQTFMLRRQTLNVMSSIRKPIVIFNLKPESNLNEGVSGWGELRTIGKFFFLDFTE